MLDREPGGPHGSRHLELASAAGRMRVRAGDLAQAPAVVLASERMDENPGWRLLDPGELLHVDGHRRISTAGSRSRTRPPIHSRWPIWSRARRRRSAHRAPGA